MIDRPVSFEEVATALKTWVGESVEVFIGPSPASAVHSDLKAGIVYAALFGTLRRSDQGPRWASRGNGAPHATTIAFQVGNEPLNYFVLHDDLMTGAKWISREHRALEVEMGTITVGVSVWQGR